MAEQKTHEYPMGYARAQSAATARGHCRISPSTVDHEEYGYLWREFLAGWKAGLVAAARADWEA